MKIKHNGEMVDVADKECKKKRCFAVQRKVISASNGKGYFSFVCATREIKGCPDEYCK
jgi:hypothetical protein